MIVSTCLSGIVISILIPPERIEEANGSASSTNSLYYTVSRSLVLGESFSQPLAEMRVSIFIGDLYVVWKNQSDSVKAKFHRIAFEYHRDSNTAMGYESSGFIPHCKDNMHPIGIW